jgi:AraC-like DNA-binding protein
MMLHPALGAMTGFTVSELNRPGQCRGRAHYYLFATSRPPVISVNSVVQVADYPPGATYGPRTLPNFELLWILHGSALWRTDVYDDAGVLQATVEEDLRPGTVALARRGSRDAYIWDCDRPSRHAYVHFQIEDIGGLGDPPTCWTISVPELAAAANLSAGHLHRLFRQRYACGPAYALDLVRLARAATALLRTNATIAEIASDCGYSNPYHFSRRFSLAYGQPPGTFRRRRQLSDPLAPVRAAGLLAVARRLLEAPGAADGSHHPRRLSTL